MIAEKNIEYTVNMGNYESLKVGARVAVDTEKVDTGDNLESFLDSALQAILADDLKEAGELTQTRDSYILSWKQK